MKAFIFGTKPAVDDRADKIGEKIVENHDIALLQEIFEDNVKDIVLGAWRKKGLPKPSVVEDARSTSNASSGLVMIDQIGTLENKKFHEFDNEEGFFGDSRADKGVLFSTVDIGIGASKLELYNTHLNSDGHKARRLQLLELASFIERTHKNKNIAILAGDFNLSPDDPIAFSNGIVLTGGRGGEGNLDNINSRFNKIIRSKLASGEYPDGMTEYQALLEILGALGFVDMWAARNGTRGYTKNVHEKSKRDKMCKPAKDNPQLCEDSDSKVLKGSSKRIDFMFISNPNDSHTFSLDFTRPRRVRYERRPNAPYREDSIVQQPRTAQGTQPPPILIKGIDMLSDHIGLSTTLLFSKKNTMIYNRPSC
ncbi:exonuclease/endonuclease/phosphatase family protein [Zobellia barbeyronii]|nr:hypothetical protein [Zobellia barbeyronii]